MTDSFIGYIMRVSDASPLSTKVHPLRPPLRLYYARQFSGLRRVTLFLVHLQLALLGPSRPYFSAQSWLHIALLLLLLRTLDVINDSARTCVHFSVPAAPTSVIAFLRILGFDGLSIV